MGEDEVLTAERKAPQRRFEAAERSEEFGEDEVVVGENESEACLLEKLAGLVWEDFDCVVVEGDEFHDEVGGGVPRVVFPEEEESSWAEGVEDVAGWSWRALGALPLGPQLKIRVLRSRVLDDRLELLLRVCGQVSERRLMY